MRPSLIVIAVLVTGAGAARADQCLLVTEAQATKAIEIIKASRGSFASYCAPCGETDVKGDVAKSVQSEHTKHGLMVAINGHTVDLAYTYYAVGDGKYRNLAMGAGCEVESVPEFVTLGKISK